METKVITKQEVADQFNITLEQVNDLREGMSATWSQIGFDCYEFAHLYESETDMIVEMTLDAGRLEECTATRGWKREEWAWLKSRNDLIELGKVVWGAR